MRPAPVPYWNESERGAAPPPPPERGCRGAGRAAGRPALPGPAGRRARAGGRGRRERKRRPARASAKKGKKENERASEKGERASERASGRARARKLRQEDSGTSSWISKDQNLLSILTVNHFGFVCHSSLFGCFLSSALVQYHLLLIQKDSRNRSLDAHWTET